MNNRNINFDDHNCKICEKFCKNRRSLGNHLARSHKPYTLKEYVLEFYLSNKWPKCLCGCDEKVNWFKSQYRFNDYISGHNEGGFSSCRQSLRTPEQEKQRIESIKRVYAERGDDIKRKISESLKKTFSNKDQKTRMSEHANRLWSKPEFRKKVSESQKKAWKENYEDRYEKIFTDEFRKKISLSNMERNIKRVSEQERRVIEKIRKILSRDVELIEDKWINFDSRSACFDGFIPEWDLLIELDGAYWHGLDRDRNFTLDQIHNMSNDIIKNNLVRARGQSIARINMDIFESQDFIKIEEMDDFLDISYFLMINGNILKDEMFKFEDHNHPLIERDNLIRLNHESLGGKGKSWSEENLLDVVTKFFHLYIDKNGWFYPESDDEIKDVMSSLRSREIDDELEVISSITKVGNDFLKSRFRSYWDVRSGPAESSKNIDRLRKVIKYRMGINNSKSYDYIMSGGQKFNCNEHFDLSPKNVRRGFIVQRSGVSWFKPTAAFEIYRKFLGDNDHPVVWDPSIGFGARMLGFSAAYPGGTYVGTDPSTRIYEDAVNLGKEIRDSGEFRGIFDLRCEGSEAANLEDYSFDLIFTSPPYHDREKYFDELGQCWKDYPKEDAWIKNYLIPTLVNSRNHLKEGGLIVLNFDDKRSNIVKGLLDDLGLTLVDEISLLIGRDHFSRSQGKTDNKTEPILILKKDGSL